MKEQARRQCRWPHLLGPDDDEARLSQVDGSMLTNIIGQIEATVGEQFLDYSSFEFSNF